MEQLKLKDLTFCDLYIAMGEPQARYRKDRTTVINSLLTLPPDYNDDVEALRRILSASIQQDFSIDHDGIRYRVARMEDVNGTWFVLIRAVSTLPQLEKTGIDPLIIQQLQMLGRTSGLILITGATGAGKTTTSGALLCDYLNRYGDVAVTVEDPPELPLSGDYAEGKGRCFQVDVDEDNWEGALKACLRYRPRYIFVGEIRMPGAAFQVLRAAVSGHVVIATMHAGSIEQAIEGLVTLAAERAGNIANILVADGLTAVIHQKLAIKMQATSLFVGHSLGDPVRALIREKKFGALTTIIQQQEARREEQKRQAGLSS